MRAGWDALPGCARIAPFALSHYPTSSAIVQSELRSRFAQSHLRTFALSNPYECHGLCGWQVRLCKVNCDLDSHNRTFAQPIYASRAGVLPSIALSHLRTFALPHPYTRAGPGNFLSIASLTSRFVRIALSHLRTFALPHPYMRAGPWYPPWDGSEDPNRPIRVPRDGVPYMRAGPGYFLSIAQSHCRTTQPIHAS